LRSVFLGALLCGVLAVLHGPAAAEETPPVEAEPAGPEDIAVHGQFTFVTQYHPAFHSAFSGPQSIARGDRSAETVSQTSYLGARLWEGAEAWANPEAIQGFGLSRTLGAGGYVNGEAFKIGSWNPYLRLQRVFVRQTIALGGDVETVEADLNQLAGTRTGDRIVLTLGKFAVTDIFDNNRYAHDTRNDFLNWTIWDLGAWDFAADSWGYTYGAAAEWYQHWWALRAGALTLSNRPNTRDLDTKPFDQWEAVVEGEERHEIAGQPGKVRLLGYANFARMAKLSDFLHQLAVTGTAPALDTLRRNHVKPGAGINVEQQLLPDLGAFARASFASGHYEAYDFTDVDRSLSGGLSLSGNRWNRPDDTIGLGGAINRISRLHKEFFAAGGFGILAGDGALPHSGSERILEAYYSFDVLRVAKLTFDYQLIVNPAYNRDRGPVSILGIRFHAQL
jgi:high affinity Mn2+ porin